jgi:hypothetical protein
LKGSAGELKKVLPSSTVVATKRNCALFSGNDALPSFTEEQPLLKEQQLWLEERQPLFEEQQSLSEERPIRLKEGFCWLTNPFS